MSCAVFEKQKQQSLGGVDLSRKGSIDEAIVELVNFINQQNDYFTTSSCSGRLILFEEVCHICYSIREAFDRMYTIIYHWRNDN